MAFPEIKKEVTYKIPNERFGMDDSEGKTSKMTYTGPSELVLWMDKETHKVVDAWHPDEEPDRPLALDLYRMTLDSDTTANVLRMMLLWGGIPITKLYEVAVGPDTEPNARVVDPTDVREVYRIPVDDWDGEKWLPLQYINHHKNYSDNRSDTGEESWTWDLVRQKRNRSLGLSDNSVNEDMPADLKDKWLDYRKKLRDLPEDWKDVPVDLIREPKAPDDDSPDPLLNDPDQPYIKIADRTDEDKLMLKQFVKGVK